MRSADLCNTNILIHDLFFKIKIWSPDYRLLKGTVPNYQDKYYTNSSIIINYRIISAQSLLCRLARCVSGQSYSFWSGACESRGDRGSGARPRSQNCTAGWSTWSRMSTRYGRTASPGSGCRCWLNLHLDSWVGLDWGHRAEQHRVRVAVSGWGSD